MLKFLIGLLVVVAMFVGGDIFLRTVTESRAEDQMKAVLDLRRTPDVTLGGWPFMLRALGGTFPTVDVDIPGARIEGVRIDRIEIELRNVEFSLGALLSGSQDAVRSAGGSGKAVMDEAALGEALADQGVDARLSLNDDGTVTIRDQRLPEPAIGEMRLEGRRLVISAQDAPLQYAFHLPRLIDGLGYESLAVGSAEVTIDFLLAAGRLQAP